VRFLATKKELAYDPALDDDHLLRNGVGVNTVRDWLVHVQVDTTNIYAWFDPERNAKAIAQL
jgi:hypothetical protein